MALSRPDVVVRPHERRELSGLMGCRASVTVVGVEDPSTRRRMLTVAEWRLRELEQRWSRFLPDSEMTLLARAAGTAVPVSAATRELVRHLVRAWEATDGAFDPTLLPALVAHGYAASRIDSSLVTELRPDAVAGYDPRAIEVDDDAGTVRLPRGGTLDPGGLGKGLAADLVAEELADRGATGAMVEIGGDLRVVGDAPWGPEWLVDVEDPRGDRPPLTTVALHDGGVATSSRLRRRWPGPDGQERHHLVDPRTGASRVGDVVTCTVVCGTAAWSEAFTKAAFVLDRDAALALLDREGVPALLAHADGTVATDAAWMRAALPAMTP